MSGTKKAKQDLPHGWIQKQSSSHPDRAYYFNTITGASMWDEPQLMADSTVRQDAIGRSGDKKKVLAKFLAVRSPPLSEVMISSSLDPKLVHKTSLKRLEKERRMIVRKLNKIQAAEEQSPNKTAAAANCLKHRMLKRKNFNSPIVHKKNCRKLRVAAALSEVQSNDIEMLDISKQKSPQKSPSKLMTSPLRDSDDETKPYFIVVDTNILIHDLKFVDELKDKPLQGHGPPVIVVPWIVFHELDNIKNYRNYNYEPSPTKNAESPRLAGEAIKFLNTMLMAKHPRIRGQTCAMAMQEISSMKPKCNDDKVLHCCLQLIEVSGIPRERVVLLTNDKNLCNKAIINEIKAHTTDSVLNDFQVDFCPVIKKPSVYSAFSNLPSDLQVKMIAEVKDEVDTIVCRMKALLKDSFSKILESEMKNAYSDLWLKTIYLQPPWSFLDILECFKRHWFALFNFVFSRSMFSQLEILRTAMRETKGYVHDEHQAANIISASLALCSHIEDKYNDMPGIVKELKTLQKQCQHLCRKIATESTQEERTTPKSKGHVSLEERHKEILMVFQQTWASLNNICGTVLDSLGHPHCFKYNEPAVLPSEQETREFLERFYGPLQKLTLCMHNVLRGSLKGDDSLSKFVASLYESLTNFLPGLDLPMPIPVQFSVKDMEEFCGNPGKKELMDNGYQQLLNFYSTIHRSLSLISDDS